MSPAALQAIRDIASRKAAAYSHVLFFTRRFTSAASSGALVALAIRELTLRNSRSKS